MAIRKFKPTSPGRRSMTVTDFAEVTRAKPEKSLLRKLKKSGGRNNQGRTTIFHRGGGHKRRYRVSLTRGGWKYVRSYKAPGSTRVDTRSPETFGLRPGMRLKAKGFFADDGRFYSE